MDTPTRKPIPRSRTAALAAVLLAVAAGGAVAPQPASAQSQTGYDTQARQQDTAEMVTLVTGDRVAYDPADPTAEPQIFPAAGREELDFYTSAYDGHAYVVPSDAQRLVDDGSLDPRLFDVAGLVEDGYDDASSGALPLLLTGGDSAVAEAEPLADSGIEAVEVAKDEAADTWDDLTDGGAERTLADGVDGLWLDGRREVQLEESVPQIGAPAAWEAGYTGEGVTVAVLDTGADTDHPDLAGRILETRDFTGADDAHTDVEGHGTHVSSTISGTGAASGGLYKGVAPEADLLVGKVCDDWGCAESAIIAGMQWAAESGADIVNLSLSGPDFTETDPVELALNDLSSRYGTLFVVAAGNDGNDRPVGSPGSAAAALTVGAVDGQDLLADFSSAGGVDSGLKPDITAPGVDITAARTTDTWDGSPAEEDYTSESGTSMATPHVAGAAALLLQAHPDWDGAQLKSVLMGSASPNAAYGAFEQGAGRVDVAQAVGQDVQASPASVSVGLMDWPHEDDAPATQAVTYRNTGDADVTLSLALEGRSPDGSPSPEGVFAVDRTSLTVPAGGEAAVNVTVDTTGDVPNGRYSAYLAATGDGAEVVTPIGVDREAERYDVTVETFGRDGAVPTDGTGVLLNVDTLERFGFPIDDETATIRVPAGSYHVDAKFHFGESAEFGAHMIQPVLEVRSDVTATLDAADAGRIDIGFDAAADIEGLDPYHVSEQYVRMASGEPIGSGVSLGSTSRFYMGGVGEAVEDEALEVVVDGAWGVPDAEGDFKSSPVMFHAVLFEHGQMPAGIAKQYTAAEMARVDVEYRAPTVAEENYKSWTVAQPGWRLYEGMPVDAPMSRAEYLPILDDGPWQASYSEADLDVPEGEPIRQYSVSSPWREYEGGQAYSDAAAAAVIGPGIPSDRESGMVDRYGDEIAIINLPLFADAETGTHGYSTVDSARTALYAGDEHFGETDLIGFGFFEVPGEETDYRLEVEAVRDTYADLSTEVRGTWEFTSAHTDDYTPLPLIAVKFAPRGLDVNHTVDARRTTIDLVVENQQGPIDGAETELEVSFDDGGTWRQVEVCDGSATVKHPAGTGYVSLRATASDGEGNRVTQEIIHAYGYR